VTFGEKEELNKKKGQVACREGPGDQEIEEIPHLRTPKSLTERPANQNRRRTNGLGSENVLVRQLGRVPLF